MAKFCLRQADRWRASNQMRSSRFQPKVFAVFAWVFLTHGPMDQWINMVCILEILVPQGSSAKVWQLQSAFVTRCDKCWLKLRQIIKSMCCSDFPQHAGLQWYVDFSYQFSRNWVVCEIRILSRHHVLTRHPIFSLMRARMKFGRPAQLPAMPGSPTALIGKERCCRNSTAPPFAACRSNPVSISKTERRRWKNLSSLSTPGLMLTQRSLWRTSSAKSNTSLEPLKSFVLATALYVSAPVKGYTDEKKYQLPNVQAGAGQIAHDECHDPSSVSMTYHDLTFIILVRKPVRNPLGFALKQSHALKQI